MSRLTHCPNCEAVWGFDEIQFQECDACGYPTAEADYSSDEDYEGDEWDYDDRGDE